MSTVDDTKQRSGVMLEAALGHLQTGLYLLDCAGAPGQIGAQVDLAIHRLRHAMSASSGPVVRGDVEAMVGSR